MAVFGIIMLLAAVQLLVVGSVIQRGNTALIPEQIQSKVENLPEYARMFGNRIILLGLIAVVCTVMSFSSTSFIYRPIIIFGLGIVLVVILFIIDYKKFTK